MIKFMLKAKVFLGKIMFISGIILLLVLLFVRKSDGISTFNIFDMVIPQPPVWTSYIPIFGYFLSFIYEMFSFNGFLIIFSSIFAGIGYEISNSKK